MIKTWIERRITELHGSEDEILTNLAYEQLEVSPHEEKLCPKRMQLNLTGRRDILTPAGFLGSQNAGIFMKELWKLLMSAQKSPVGIVSFRAF